MIALHSKFVARAHRPSFFFSRGPMMTLRDGDAACAPQRRVRFKDYEKSIAM
jgi:hypothetical protein